MLEVLIEQMRQRNWRMLQAGLVARSLKRKLAPAGAVTTFLPTHPQIAELLQMDCPVVRLGRREHPDDSAVPAVLPDWTQAGRMAADHFAERGFANMAVLSHATMVIGATIEQGLRERAEAIGANCHRLMLEQTEKYHRTHDETEEVHQHRNAVIAAWLNDLPKPVGLLTANGYYAGIVGVLCDELGIAIPEQVALLATGDHQPLCELANVPISAIDIGRPAMTRIAVDLLAQMMDGKTISAQTFVPPPRIITRRSTDILAVDHPLVARAIRFIWDRLDQELSVDDVAEAMRVPRYKLERLFRKYHNCGIHAELRRKRLQRFAELLRTTDRPVRELAPRVGFNSTTFLHESFCKEYGQTPRAYRLEARSKRKGQKPAN